MQSAFHTAKIREDPLAGAKTLGKATAEGPPRRRLDAEQRRGALIRATIEVLAEGGPREATVRVICARAGVSHGLLRHYFAGQESLVAAACRSLTQDYDTALERFLTQGEGPARERLRAFFRHFFSDHWIDDRALGAWVAYWSLVRSNAEVAEIHRESYARQRRRIAEALRQMAAEESLEIDAEAEALGITALLDGLWLEHSLDRPSFSAQAAISLCEVWLDRAAGG